MMSIAINKRSSHDFNKNDPLRNLENAFQECYNQGKVENSKLPSRIIQELQHKTLFIADSEISQEEIPILCQFLKRQEAIVYIETLIIANNSIIGKAHNRKCTHFKPGKVSALFLDNSLLFRSLLSFITKAKNVKRIIIDSVQITMPLIVRLSEAIMDTKSGIRWFGMKSCPLKDEGMNILSVGLGRIKAQIIAFENCELTDKSCSSIARLIKTHMNRMDTGYWNATLRYGISDFYLSNDTIQVASSGLVALSLNGNRITGSGLDEISRALETNFWFLGLSVANNLITTEHIKSFLEAIAPNKVLHAVIFRGNPGYIRELSILGIEIVNRNESRLHVLPEYIVKLLESWISIQRDDYAELFKFQKDSQSKSAVDTATNYRIPMNNSASKELELDDSLLPQPLINMVDLNLSDNDSLIDDDTMEYATPPPPILREGYLPAGNHASSLSALDISGIDGRPPSRNSLRPRRDSKDRTDENLGRIKGDRGVRSRKTIKDVNPLTAPPFARAIMKSAILPRDRRPASAPPKTRSNKPEKSPILTRNITTARKSEYHPRKRIPMSAVERIKKPQNESKRRSSSPPVPRSSISNRRKSKSPMRGQDDLYFKGTVKRTTEYFERLSEAVLAATNNLASVSAQLQEMASTLSDTISTHSKIMHSIREDSTPGPLKSSITRPFSVSNSKISQVESSRFSPERSPALAHSSLPSQTETLQPHRDLRSSMDKLQPEDLDFPITHRRPDSIRDSGESGHGVEDNDTTLTESIRDDQLSGMIRNTLRERLSSLLLE